jgi:hypothetical protein
MFNCPVWNFQKRGKSSLRLQIVHVFEASESPKLWNLLAQQVIPAQKSLAVFTVTKSPDFRRSKHVISHSEYWEPT